MFLLLYNINLPSIFAMPFILIAVTTKTAFTIEPIINCEFVAITLCAPKIVFNNCPKKVGTKSAIKNNINV